MKIRVASHNQGKIKEFKAILEPLGYEVLSGFEGIDDIEETGSTFEENSFIKAETIYKASNDLVIADDSGLIIDALPDLLGVYSARFEPSLDYYGKNLKLLSLLEGNDHRTARFHSSIALVGPGVSESFSGTIEGNIAQEIKGSEGFGYDPIFIPKGYSESFAEMDASLKNTISHRAIALKKFTDYIKESLNNA